MTEPKQSDVLRRVLRFTRTGDIVLVIVPLVLGATFGGIAAATRQWMPATIIWAISFCVSGAFLWRARRNLGGLSRAFGSDASQVVWVYAKWNTRKPSGMVPTDPDSVEGAWINIGLLDGAFCRLRLPRRTAPAEIAAAMEQVFPNAVHGYRDDFPAAFKSNPTQFRQRVNQTS